MPNILMLFCRGGRRALGPAALMQCPPLAGTLGLSRQGQLKTLARLGLDAEPTSRA
jgi:hypothetical protein